MQQQSVILVVDDNPDDVFFLERALLKAEIPAILAVVGDGSEALDYLGRRGKYWHDLKSPWPNLIILDLKMPRMNGFEVLTWICRHPHVASLPVIVLTGSNDPHDAAKALRLGASSVLLKPADPRELTSMAPVVRQYLPSAAPLNPHHGPARLVA
jgi:CheY-like chemotaxis protein